MYADFRNRNNLESEINRIERSLLVHSGTKEGANIPTTENLHIHDVSAGQSQTGSYVFNKDAQDWIFFKRLQSDKRYTMLNLFGCVVALLLSLSRLEPHPYVF